MRRGVALLLILATLAGCTDDTPTNDDAPVQDEAGEEIVVDPVLTGAEPPTWEIGQFWEYQTASGLATRIVTADKGDHYIVDTDQMTTAYYDAATDISTLGPIYKKALEGSQGQDKIEFLKFPLSDGATWKTTWDGVEREITAAKDGQKWQMTAIENGTFTRAEYVYDPAVKWFESMLFYNDDGSEMFSMILTKTDLNYTGPIFRMELEEFFGGSVQGQGSEGNPEPSNPPTGTDIIMELRSSCTGAGVVEVVFGSFESTTAAVSEHQHDQGYRYDGICPDDVAISEVIAEAPFDDNWAWGITSTSDTADVSLSVIVRTHYITQFPAP